MWVNRLIEFLRQRMSGRFFTLKLAYIWFWCKLVPADKRLARYKDIHKGERCFLVGTAPSLELDDIEQLRRHNEYTFSCNSIIKIYGKTQWRPTYFMLIDPYVDVLYHEAIIHMEKSVIFYNQMHIPVVDRGAIALKVTSDHLIREEMYRKSLLKEKPKLNLPLDLTKKIPMGQSTIHVALMLAVWMGFTDIYLLGVDCDYSGLQHSRYADDERFYTPEWQGWEMVQDFEDLKPQLEAIGVRVKNCSRGGKLKVFPCVSLESVLEEENKVTAAEGGAERERERERERRRGHVKLILILRPDIIINPDFLRQKEEI